jgi:hypothetical protein
MLSNEALWFCASMVLWVENGLMILAAVRTHSVVGFLAAWVGVVMASFSLLYSVQAWLA